MRGLDQPTARYAILMIAGLYIVLLGLVEAAKLTGSLDPWTASEIVQKITTLASLSVGTVLGFYLASKQRQS